MSDIDRIFPGLAAAATPRRELVNVPRRRVGGSRVVEVVRLRPSGGANGATPPRRDDARVRAAAWDHGFPVAAGPAPPVPGEVPSSRPVVHVMPAWERRPVEVQSGPPAETDAAVRPGAPEAKRRPRASTASRRVADPYDPTDEGANRLRCGYAVEPARERQGMMRCAGCT